MAGAPNVKLEGGVYSELRYHHLGALLGTSNYDAIGRMGHLWQFCTLQQTYVLEEALVRTVLSPDALVSAGLGERVEGGVRIKGTEGRIEWYGRLRESGRRSARKRWGKGRKQPNGSPNGLPTGSPIGHPMGGPINSRDSNSSSSLSGKGERGKGKPVEHELPADWAPTEAHCDQATKLGLNLADQVVRFRAHAETHARRAVRWNSAFTMWLTRAKEFSASEPKQRHFKVTGNEVYRDGEVEDF